MEDRQGFVEDPLEVKGSDPLDCAQERRHALYSSCGVARKAHGASLEGVRPQGQALDSGLAGNLPRFQ